MPIQTQMGDNGKTDGQVKAHAPCSVRIWYYNMRRKEKRGKYEGSF